jgi:hypothetical protein
MPSQGASSPLRAALGLFRRPVVRLHRAPPFGLARWPARFSYIPQKIRGDARAASRSVRSAQRGALWGEGQDGDSGCGTNEEAGKHVEGIMNTEVDAGKGDEYT